MTINTNGATNLVGGQVEMAMSLALLKQAQVLMDNAYVAMLSPDRQSWMIQESLRTNNVYVFYFSCTQIKLMCNSTDMTVRMVKRSQLDGEYMIVGRQTAQVNTLVTPFGSDPGTAVNILGTGIQENEFQDGFRLSVRASQPMTMNVNVKDGIDSSMLAALKGQMAISK